MRRRALEEANISELEPKIVVRMVTLFRHGSPIGTYRIELPAPFSAEQFAGRAIAAARRLGHLAAGDTGEITCSMDPPNERSSEN